jgi:nuclear pore complex protein Nup50
LFLKPINNGEGTQLIIRADTTLASILLNVKLNKIFPTAKEGSKDVSYLCIPNPPIPNTLPNAPCKFLFKVKTEDDAEELLEKLNEYKK